MPACDIGRRRGAGKHAWVIMKPITRLIAASALSLTVATLACTTLTLFAQAGGDPLAAGFRDPPDSARPRTWWHWTMGNVTMEGITKDLEWMKRAGIGGFMLADVNAGGGQAVAHRIQFGTPEWFDAVRHAAAEADRLGLEMAIFSSPGWSETGGPWVKPNEAMKKLVWSETTIAGPRKFSGKLADPPRNNGQIRNAGAPARAGADLARKVPLLEGREAIGGRPTVYICRDRSCDAPITTLGELEVRLERLER